MMVGTHSVPPRDVTEILSTIGHSSLGFGHSRDYSRRRSRIIRAKGGRDGPQGTQGPPPADGGERRRGAGGRGGRPAQPLTPQAAMLPVPQATVQAAGAPAQDTAGLIPVESPMVGTFYRAQ